MTLIDHRVLVSAPPEVIWELLGDLTTQSKWHTNITQCSVLTTHHTGEGVRYRLHTKRGPDLVCQILSWYNNLGYEYVVIDGPFGKNRGLVRLQATPEGTTVQWTFEYEYRGFGSGLRDRIGVKRRLDKETTDSLKQLRRLVESAGIRMDPDTRDRVAMQPAPSAKERASLSEDLTRAQSILPVAAQSLPVEPVAGEATRPLAAIPSSDESLTAPATAASDQPITREISPPTPERTPVVVVEPPFADDDTRPNPSVQQQETLAEPPAATLPEPAAQPAAEVVNRLVAEPADIRLADDYEEPPTEPKGPDGLSAAIAAQEQPVIISGPDETPADEESLAPITRPVETTPEPSSAPTDKMPTPAKDTTPVSLPVITASEADPSTNPDITEPVLEPAVVTPEPTDPITRPTPPITVVSEPVPPADTEPQFTDTIGAVLSDEQSPTEEPPPGPSLLEQNLKPLGPSIWDVFDMDAPSQDEVASEPTAPDVVPPPVQPPGPVGKTLPQVENIAPPAVDSGLEETTTKHDSGQKRQIVSARSASRHPGLRRQLDQRQSLIQTYRRPKQ